MDRTTRETVAVAEKAAVDLQEATKAMEDAVADLGAIAESGGEDKREEQGQTETRLEVSVTVPAVVWREENILGEGDTPPFGIDQAVAETGSPPYRWGRYRIVELEESEEQPVGWWLTLEGRGYDRGGDLTDEWGDAGPYDTMEELERGLWGYALYDAFGMWPKVTIS